MGSQIKTRVQELGHGCIYLVQKAGALQMSPTDSFTKRELIEYARAVTEKVGSLKIVGSCSFCALAALLCFFQLLIVLENSSEYTFKIQLIYLELC